MPPFTCEIMEPCSKENPHFIKHQKGTINVYTGQITFSSNSSNSANLFNYENVKVQNATSVMCHTSYATSVMFLTNTTKKRMVQENNICKRNI